MSAYKLGEIVTDALIAKLKNGMDGRCAAINLDKDDGLVVTPPALSGGRASDGSDYFAGGAGNLADGAYPVIAVAEGPGIAEGEGAEGFIYAAEFMVMILEADPNRETLGRKLQRQARAVLEVLLDDPPKKALLDSAFYLYLDRTIPGPVFDDAPDSWRGIYRMIFTIQQAEGA